MRRKVRLTESDLHRIVKESMSRILKESDTTKQIEELERQIEEHKYEIERLEREINELEIESGEFKDITARTPWSRGPEPWHTNGY